MEITVIELAYPDVEGELITIPQPKGDEVVLRKIGNDYIWVGDIILNKDQIKNFYENRITERTALSTLSKHWPKATIYYKISSNLPNQQRVTNAIDRWKQSAPYLNFVVRTNQTNYIEFIPESECSSNLGMIGGRQLIKLAPTCTMGNAMHEIGHAIGLLHEQTRTDRD